MNNHRPVKIAVLLCAGLFAYSASIARGGWDEATFQKDLEALTVNPHRLGGMEEGSLAAGKYVEKRLREIGIEEIYIQRFPVIQPITTQCELILDGKSYPIHAMRPNILQAPVTPEEGITGTTMYVGTGELSEYGKRTAENKIVVMEFDSENNWSKAFAFGARAVLFVGVDKPAANAFHHINLPANLPRFCVPEAIAQELRLRERPQTIKLLAACEWRELRGRNVIAVIRGTQPEFGKKNRNKDNPDQAIVLAAPLDSLSEVPVLSPGARDAANCAGLLQAGEYFRKHPPRRDVILCFFDAQCQNHMGARAFYGALYRFMGARQLAPLGTLETRLTRFEKERHYLLQLANILSEIAPLTDLWKSWGQLNEQKDELQDKQTRLRGHREQLDAEVKKLQETGPGHADRLTELARQIAETELEIQALSEQIAKLEAQMIPCKEKMSAPKMIERDFFSASMREMPRHDRSARFLRDEAAVFDSEVLEELSPMRVDMRKLKDQLEDAQETKLLKDRAPTVGVDETIRDIQEQIAKLDSQIKVLEKRDLGWNGVIRDIFQETITEESRGRFARLIEEAGKVLARRQGELDQSITLTKQSIAIRDALGEVRNNIVLHVSFNLSDARNKWTFVHGDDTVPFTKNTQDKSGNYKAIFLTMHEVRRSWGDRLTNFDDRAISGIYETKTRLFAPGMFVDSGAIARLFAIYNLAAMTSMDRLPLQGQPADTLSALNSAVVYKQLRTLVPYLKDLADDKGLDVASKIRVNVRFDESAWSGDKSIGPSVKQAGAGSAMADRPVRDAIVAIVRKVGAGPWNGGTFDKVPPGFVFPILTKTDTNGIFEIGPYCIAQQDYYYRPVIFAATFDRTPVGTDEIAESYRTRGIISSVTNERTFQTKVDANLTKAAVNLFKTRTKTFVGHGFTRGALKTIAMRSGSTAKFYADRHLVCEIDNTLALFAPYDAKGLKLFNKAGLVVLNNAPTKREHQGMGISLADEFEHRVTSRLAAHDLRALNSYRLEVLRDSRIKQESLEILNGKAHDLEMDAEGQLSTDPTAEEELTSSLDKHIADQEASAALSRRAYIPLVGVMNDLVTAVVFLLLLTIPFAYSLERLLIGTPHIYRQIGWFSLFFAITFAVLYVVNPAFKIAATPIIIFLAFSIILLSTLVIFIMVRKLQTEIKKMQGLATTVHSADVSRLSTMMAAVNMGISTMRRRPVRTTLTAVTVVLLTFTILTFASFGSSWDIRTKYEGSMVGSPERVLVRHQLWGPIGDGIFETLRGHFTDEATVVGRYWISSTAKQAENQIETELLLATGDQEKITPVAAAVGLDVRDIRMQPHLKDMFMDESGEAEQKKLIAQWDMLEGDGIILTEALSDALGLTDRDIGDAKVLLAGRELTYAGIVSDRLASFTLVEGSSMLPVDYQASGGSEQGSFTQESKTETLSEMPDVESAQFVHYNLDRVVIIGPEVAKTMKGKIRQITIYANNPAETRTISERAAKISELPSYVGDREGVTRMIFTSLTKARGVRDLFIPVLLGGLIIFATMLGSVSDREREIYTFSSLGLAPPHVASLFFAEASVYAVVGGMGGYLLGQVVTRILGYLATLGWVSVPSMNYSSTNAIVTVLIVMGTVLISTVYPAMKASRSANPGIQRSWRIPKPEGNLYDLIFPFTVSTYDIIGVVSFFKEHFDNYSDTSLGVFANMDCGIFRQKENDMLGFRASVALAPFDLGVTQNFAMLSKPSDIEGIDEVRVMIYRLSGAHGDWQRSNRVFINELRKQLLIWRTLPQDIMDRYRQKTLESWDELPVEEVDTESIGAQA